MRKLFVCICLLSVVPATFSLSYAGGIENNHNYSVEYLRTLNRNGATDFADIVAYNPAGVMKLENGAVVNLSAQSFLKTYTNSIAGTDYESDTPSCVPGLFGVYKRDQWAAFFGLTVVAGGGKVEYDSGNATTNAAGLGLITGLNAALGAGTYNNISSQNLNGESNALAYTVGGAVQLHDKVSLSLGARYIDSKKGGDGAITVNNFASDAVPEQTANIDFSKEATGWSGVLGVNLSPTDRLNIGLRYEMSTKLDYEDKVSQDNMGLLQNLGISDGNKTRYDLPAVFGLGVAHKITPDLTTHVTLTYYFQESADWNGAEDNVENGYDLGIAFEYDVNDKLKASLGYLYTDTGLDAENMTPEMPELNASTIGGGVAYTLAPGLDLNFGAGFVFCQDDSFVNTATGAEIEYRKDILFLAFGIQYKFM